MSLLLEANLVEPFVGGLLGGIDVDDGPSDEQLAVLQALVVHLWDRPDLDVGSMKAIGPAQTAQILTGHLTRRRFHELHMTLESCRHPQSAAQIARVEQYATALGTSGADLALFRSLVDEGRERAALDFGRFFASLLEERSEPSLGSVPGSGQHAEPELAQRLMDFADLADGSLGRAYLAFYQRHGLTLPGVHPSPLNHFFVAHDMTHVIAGLGTTAQAEVALSAFQMGMNDNDTNVSALLASLVCHEAGFGTPGTFEPEEATLASPGAARLLAEELARGSACVADFSLVDHFALAAEPLDHVRRTFGVMPPADPEQEHHCW